MPAPGKPKLQPRKAPIQGRSQATVQIIMQAAAKVLSTESLAGFNTNRVAQIAGVSVGSLYQYFPGKEALVVALIEQQQAHLAERLALLVDSQRSAALDDTLYALTEFAIDQQYADPLLAAALDHEERRLPLQKRLKRAEAQLVQLGLNLLRAHRPEISIQEVQDIYVMIKALVESELDSPTPPANLKARIVRAVKGYLG
jgi:AcrR family transcriptional regulator